MPENNITPKYPCDVNIQKIKALEKRQEKTEIKMDDICDKNHNSDLVLERISVFIEQAIKTNEIQNKKLDLINQQYLKTNETMTNMNENLNCLNKGLKATNKEVDKLKGGFDKAEEKNKIDIRLIIKKIFFNMFVPLSVGGGIVYFFTEVLNK